MAYFGDVERRNLHGLFCIPVVPKSLAGMTHMHALVPALIGNNLLL